MDRLLDQRLALVHLLRDEPSLLQHHLRCKMPEWFLLQREELRTLLELAELHAPDEREGAAARLRADARRDLSKVEDALSAYRRAGWVAGPAPDWLSADNDGNAPDPEEQALLAPLELPVTAPARPTTYVFNWSAAGLPNSTNEEFVRALDYARLLHAFTQLSRQFTKEASRAAKGATLLARLRSRLRRTKARLERYEPHP